MISRAVCCARLFDELVALAVDVDALPDAVVVQDLDANLRDSFPINGNGSQANMRKGIHDAHGVPKWSELGTGHGNLHSQRLRRWVRDLADSAVSARKRKTLASFFRGMDMKGLLPILSVYLLFYSLILYVLALFTHLL